MRTLATIAIATAATFGLAAPATADATPFPVCQQIYTLDGRWFGAVCVNPAHPDCIVAGGGYVWNMCMINPL